MEFFSTWPDDRLPVFDRTRAGSGFPTTADTFQKSFGGSEDAFVTELNASGSALISSTYLGGSSQDRGVAIALDSADDVHLTSFASSGNHDFPITTGAFQTTYGGGVPDTFVVRICTGIRSRSGVDVRSRAKARFWLRT